MRLLLDSHVILWWSGFEAGKLSAASRQAIANADAVFFSVASVWELEIKQRIVNGTYQIFVIADSRYFNFTLTIFICMN